MRVFLLSTTTLFVFAGSLLCAPANAGFLKDANPLVDAAKAGDLPKVQEALKRHINPNEAEADGTTALEFAVHGVRPDIVKALIAAGADVNAKNQYGITPLGWALNSGSPAIAVQLLAAGANPNVLVPEMGTPMLAAAHSGSPELITSLLKAGVNVNDAEPKSKQTALMWAVAEGHEAAVKTLLAAGADVHLHSAKNETALFFAVRKGDIGIVDALLGAGADANERADISTGGGGRNGNRNQAGGDKVPGDSMLVLSILNAHFDLAKFLIDKGADPNMTGARWTALHALSRVRNFEQMQYPAPDIKPGDLDTLELAKILLAHGANPNARGMTPVAKRDGGDQNYVEFRGATPFFLAAKSADIPYMRLLLSAGADPGIATEEHTTPLMVAAGVGCVTGQWLEPEDDVLAAVKILVEEYKGDINATDDRDGAAIHGAVCRNADSVIQYLVDKGAKLNIKDSFGQTPLDMVSEGMTRAITINGPPLISLHALDHTAALVKRLTAEQNAAMAKETAQR